MGELVRARHYDLDGAWQEDAAGLPAVEMRTLGAGLRFCTLKSRIGRYREACRQTPAQFVLYGSGDFHHLTAVHLSLVREPVVVVSFDNHPDWDRRPPAWQCGAWVNRALELEQVQQVHLWGCTSADAHWPGRLFANPSALKSGRVQAHLYDPEDTPEWRSAFEKFAKSIAGRAVYITVDLDCISPAEMTTNWDAGTLDVESLVFALRALRSQVRLVGGDLCGGWSEEIYERPLQRFAAWVDHPKETLPSREKIAARNGRVLRAVWPALTGEDDADADGHEQDAQDQAAR